MIESLRAPGVPSHEPKASIMGLFDFKRLDSNRLKSFQKNDFSHFFSELVSLWMAHAER